MTAPSRADLAAARAATVADLLPHPLRLLFVGINPGLWSAAVNAHFARPGNRFWPALATAGITTSVFDVSGGMSDVQRTELAERGVGITNLVQRTTARADELTTAELRDGAVRLRSLVERTRPRVVAVAGITAYRTAFAHPKAAAGRQSEPLAGATVFVVPNPSGLNAHETAATLAAAYRAAADAAGL